MKHRPCLTLLLFLFAALATAQPQMPPAAVQAEKTCTVFGIAPGREGNVIGLYQYDDYITMTEKMLAQTIVGDSGKFSLSVDVSEVTYLFLRCQNLRGFLYAEPGRKVELIFPKKNKDMPNPDVEYEVELNIYVDNDSTDMNFLASDYNDHFYQWWQNNYTSIVSKDSVSVIDSFQVKMDKYYSWVKNPYFQPWMDYGLAQMENATFHSSIVTGRRYVLGKKIYYHNSEYMSFFNDFFRNFLYKWSLRTEGEGTVFAINQMASYDSLMGAMKRLPWMQNDTLRELVMLKSLFELYDNPAYNARNVLAICQQAAVRSRISEHRQIARNIVSFYTKLKVGSLATHFIAIDRKGTEIDPLETYKGQYIYMFFYDSKNPYSLSELRYMAELQKRYGKKIVFVSISLDEDTNAWKAFLKANPKYNWTMLHYDYRQKTKEDYNLYTVPAGFIIDPDGKFYTSPADNPSGDLEYTLYKIANPKAPAFVPQDRR